MVDTPQFEIPQPVRDMAEKNVEQARAAYNQFLDMAKKTQEMMAKSTDAMAASALEVQARAIKYAEQNVNASFAFASDLARARDLKEFMEIQARYAQRQMQAYAEQAQDLGRIVGEAAQKTTKR